MREASPYEIIKHYHFTSDGATIKAPRTAMASHRKDVLGAVATVLISINLAYAHGGGLNAEGCHNNRRTGDYHCHRSGYSPPRYVAPAQTVQPLYAPPARASKSERFGSSDGAYSPRSPESSGASCVRDAATERALCQDRRRADRERIADLELYIRDLKDQVGSLRAEVERLRRERQGYFP